MNDEQVQTRSQTRSQSRLSKVKDAILAHGLDGVALMPGANMAYVSGIQAHVSERPIVLFIPADDEPAIIIPVLEASKAEAAGIALERIFAYSDEDGYTGAFQQACAQLELADYLLGVEALGMRVLEMELLNRYAPGLNITHAEPVMDALRLRKDQTEVGLLERAVAAAEIAMHNLLPQIKPGQTEKQIAAMVMKEVLAAGADGLAFDTIVSGGPNGASPHAVPTDRPIQKGDLLVIDWGAMVDGYVSDITRTFAVGPLNEELHLVYDVVLAANEAGRRASHPGATGAEIDRAARSVIENANYGDYFIHRTGHGLGIQPHESPSLVAGNDTPLPVGSVFTVEPGIYLPGRGGVRIEDDILLTPDGHRSLTTFPRSLTTVGE